MIDLGYPGMFLAAMLAATFIPLGSEVVFAGLLALDFNPVWLTLVAGAGNTTGGIITYSFGWLGKWEWLEKWFRIEKAKVEAQMKHIRQWGGFLAFFTWLPGVGDPIAVALGFARSNVLVVIIWMAAGKTLRYALLAWGYYSVLDSAS